MIDKLKAKVSANPLLSLLFSAATSYVAMKYGPAISSVCSVVGK
jgi:hypothetical protein